MRTAVLLFFVFFQAKNFAQCPDFQLIDLQMLQRAEGSAKESSLLEMGFDRGGKVGNSLRFNKCWQTTTGGKAIYEQVIYWNVASGNITFLTPKEDDYLRLRKSIEGRHGASGSMGASDIYVGQVFRYEFGARGLDGVQHWSVAISFR
jgi:hypothetical protein